MSFIIVVVGIAGAGKSTLCQAATSALPALSKLVSATTRPPRAGEADGVDKYFLEPDRFDEKLAAGELCCPTVTYGNRYALRAADLQANGTFITEMHYANLPRLQAVHPDMLSICLIPETPGSALRQLGTRGESAHEVANRKRLVLDEHTRLVTLAQAGTFDRSFVNHFDNDSKEQFLSVIADVLGVSQAPV